MVQSDATMRFAGTSNMQLSCEGNCISVIQYIGNNGIMPQRSRNSNPAICNARAIAFQTGSPVTPAEAGVQKPKSKQTCNESTILATGFPLSRE